LLTAGFFSQDNPVVLRARMTAAGIPYSVCAQDGDQAHPAGTLPQRLPALWDL